MEAEPDAESDNFRLLSLEGAEDSDRSSGSVSGSFVIALPMLVPELGELLLFIAAAAISNFASARWMVAGLGHRSSTSAADMTARSLPLGVLVIDKDDKGVAVKS